MVVCFKHVGITDSVRERLKMSVKTLDSWSAHALSTHPGDLPVRSWLCLVLGCRYQSSGVGAVLLQSGWGYILPVWPSAAIVYVSVCYIWSISPVLSGVLCEFKCAPSNSLSLPLPSQRTWALGPCLGTTWPDDSLLSPVHLALGPCLRTTWPDDSLLSPVHLVLLLKHYVHLSQKIKGCIIILNISGVYFDNNSTDIKYDA